MIRILNNRPKNKYRVNVIIKSNAIAVARFDVTVMAYNRFHAKRVAMDKLRLTAGKAYKLKNK